MKKGAKQMVPSYTYQDTSDPNIKRFVDRKGDWTHYYLVKEKRFVKAVNWILALGFNKGPRFAAYLTKTTEEEAKRKLLKAGDEGSRTHAAISDLIRGSRVTMTTKYPSDLVAGRQEPLNDEEWDNLVAFERWCEKYKPQVVAIDQTVTGGDYAGTFDALMVLTVPEDDKCFPKEVKGQQVLVLIDWKSSSGIWNEYKAQLAAYCYALEVGHNYDNFLRAFEDKKFTAIVRIGTAHNSGYEMKVWSMDETADNFLKFKSAKVIADDHEEDWIEQPDMEEVPVQFDIRIPKAVIKIVKKKRAPKKAKDAQLDNNQQ